MASPGCQTSSTKVQEDSQPKFANDIFFIMGPHYVKSCSTPFKKRCRNRVVLKAHTMIWSLEHKHRLSLALMSSPPFPGPPLPVSLPPTLARSLPPSPLLSPSSLPPSLTLSLSAHITNVCGKGEGGTWRGSENGRLECFADRARRASVRRGGRGHNLRRRMRKSFVTPLEQNVGFVCMCVCTRVLLKATMSVWREVAHARRDCLIRVVSTVATTAIPLTGLFIDASCKFTV
jgi:hypothetical protein